MDAGYIILSLCQGTELILCTDGAYTLKHTDASSESTDTSTLFLIQCYSNGCVNKVAIDSLIALRYEYKYSHGIFPLSNLMVSRIVSATDSICVKYLRNGTERTASIDVQRLRLHSILGLKGIDIIGTSFDKVIGWYVNGDLINGYSENKKPTNTDNQVMFGNLESVAPNGFAIASNDENIYDLEDRFSAYLKNGKNIPIGQEQAKKVLAQCLTKEKFWQVIKTLFKCNIPIYRSPIIDYLNEHDITQFMPSEETLSLICEQLFSVIVKPEKNLEFLYHFKNILTDEMRDRIVSHANSFSHPKHYFKLCEMLQMDKKGLIEFCLQQSNEASYYCVYEILLNVFKEEGYHAVSKLITKYIDSMNDTSIKGVLFKRLIYNKFKKDQNKSDAEIIKVQSGGFNEYIRLCASHEGKKKTQAIQDSITSNVGKSVKGKYVTTYSNHYFFVTSDGIRILLPHSMSEKVFREGDSTNLRIVFADKAYNTLYATQKTSVDYIKIMQMPLLNNGDVIEISFDLHGTPVPHKCYKKIKINLESYPKEVDYKIRYKAKVIHQTTDRYHYLVKII